MCENPRTIMNKETGEKIKVKCGKCIICRRKKCRAWAIKLYHESQYYNKMVMITLTFRPKFLLRPKMKKLTKYKQRRMPDGSINKKTIKYTTMIGPHYILDVKKTGWLVTLFMKKFRKLISKKNPDKMISYFAVGEHGTQNTHRAHWHIIIFGIAKEELKCVEIGKSKKNKEIFFSPIIDNLWAYEKMKIGQHTVSEVTTKTIKYVANYTMKKMYNNKKQLPTTMRFSNQNKIGKKWARKYHTELRKGVLQDGDGIKYGIPESYYNEMIRYRNDIFDSAMQETAAIIETKKEETIKKLMEKGLLSESEMKKKAQKYKNLIKNQDRDTF